MAKTITSHRNPHITNAIRLRERRGRDQQGRIIVDGAREMLRGLKGGLEFVEVFFCAELCIHEDAHLAMSALSMTPAIILTVSADVFGKVAYGQRSEGIVGIAKMPEMPLNAVQLPENPLLLILESVEKPGNVGAVVRSADGAGASAVITTAAQTDLYNPNAIRASMGTLFTMPVCAASNDEALTRLRTENIQIFAARVDGALSYTDQDYTKPSAIVLGSESAGLSSIWHENDIRPIRLPMCGAGDSLNVSATAAVLLYEALRQRQSKA